MRTVIRSMRLYFWPIIVLNTASMTVVIGGTAKEAAWFAIVISLLASFGYLLNDLWDRQVDTINASKHFENSDSGTIRLGIAVCISCLLLAIGIATRLRLIEAEIAGFVALGLTLYTIIFRRYLIVPTLLASTLSASPLWAPLIFWPRHVRAMHWVFVAGLILLLAAREILMDVRDRKGDAFTSRDTVATVWGPRNARFTAGISLLGGVAILCFVLITRTVALATPDQLLVFLTGFLILGFVLIPADRAVLGNSENGADHAAIQHFVVQSRVAMALLPLLTLFLWGK